MNKELLKEYAELKIKEKSISVRIKELGPMIKKEIVDMGLDKLPTNVGNFIIKRVKKWTYTDTVKETEKKLKELMTFEEAHGRATYVEVEQLEFREIKNESED